MPATIVLQNSHYRPDEFVRLDLMQFNFQGLDAGQRFIQLWQNNKQFFDQKTSGSTGIPAIHQISRQRFIASADRTVAVLGLKPNSKALVCINMAYIGGKMMLVRGLSYNWELHLVKPDADLTQEAANSPYDFAAMVPLQVQKLVSSHEGREFLNNIGCLIIGGAAISGELINQMQELKCETYATYGMTESVSHIALQKLNGPDRSAHFTMLPGIEFGTDERGCLKVKADVTDEQWIQTNDLVAFERDREFKVLGRADNVINTGGVKVQIESLEALISESGLLEDQAFAISQLQDEALGSKIVLVLEQSPADSNQLLAKLKETLPPYQAPKAIYYTPALPKTASGKLDRPALNAWLLEQAPH